MVISESLTEQGLGEEILNSITWLFPWLKFEKEIYTNVNIIEIRKEEKWQMLHLLGSILNSIYQTPRFSSPTRAWPTI